MHAKKFICFKCGKEFPPTKIIFECSKCGYSLDIEYDYGKIRKRQESFFFEVIPTHWKYYDYYPIKDLTKIVSLQEGGTPLIKSNQFKNWLFKFEGVNPTGVFKDRGSSIEISKAKELNQKKVLCASTGNMGASIAAYCQRAGIEAEIILPDFTPEIKRNQIKAYGAKINILKGSYEKALNKTKEIRRKTNVYLVGDYPFRGEGQKSVTFEILDQMGLMPPENIVCPIGNGTLIYSVYKACIEFKKTGLIKKIPQIHGIQAEGCNPIVKAFKEKAKDITALKKTKTIASAINCNNPVDGLEALHAIKYSKGLAEDVSDKEILLARKELGKEGIYSETSGAAAFAGAKKLDLGAEKTAIIITGHGLKEFIKN